MRIYARVSAGSSREKIEKQDNGNYKIWVSAPAEKGKANKRVIEVLADYFHVHKNKVVIISGKTSRVKLVELRI